MPPPSGQRGNMGMMGRTLQEKATRRPKKTPLCWLDLAKLLELGTGKKPKSDTAI
jgi:hypothetical protein